MTRFGCVGCFSITAFLALIALVLLGGLALSSNIFEIPSAPRQDFSQEDGRRFQQKLAEILLRDSNVSFRKEPIIISQRELNAFLVRHLQESERIRFSPLIVQFTRGAVEIQGQTELRSLLNGFPFSLVRDYFPSSVNRPVWVTLKGQVTVERRRGAFIVDDFSLGRQALSPWLFTWLFGRAGSRLMEWRIPSSVERIVIEEGRAVIFTHPRAA
jgi:hypothetical protein